MPILINKRTKEETVERKVWRICRESKQIYRYLAVNQILELEETSDRNCWYHQNLERQQEKRKKSSRPPKLQLQGWRRVWTQDQPRGTVLPGVELRPGNTLE